MTVTTDSIQQFCIDTVRILSADAVQKANSGHPGTPMALAPVGHVLWSKIMNYNPRNADWANRIVLYYPAAMLVCCNTAICI